MEPSYEPDEAFALALDAADSLRGYREQFFVPPGPDGRPCAYLCGNSLGLQPRAARALVEQELGAWARLGVEGHFKADAPWYSYHELLRGPGERLVGARPGEVVMMNSLTVNLHLMMATFYRPAGTRTKLLIDEPAFPSDLYAVASQVRHHGLDPAEHLLTVRPREGEHLLREEDVEALLAERGAEVALLLFNAVNFLTGQWFDVERITRAARAAGSVAGWDLAHAAGNVPLRLHDWGVDFAAWCSYKYLNAGPGAVAGCFVHERHGADLSLPRLAGWWGNDPATRFRMQREREFVPRPGADGWQVSNPPILALAPLRASLALFDAAGMVALRAKSERLTGYLLYLLDRLPPGRLDVLTPRERSRRGCQLSLAIHNQPREVLRALQEAGVVCDFREPNIVRVAAAPLYNTFHDVWRFAAAWGAARREPAAPGRAHRRRVHLAARVAAQRLLPLAVHRVRQDEPVDAPAPAVGVDAVAAVADRLSLPRLVVRLPLRHDELLRQVAQVVADQHQHGVALRDLLAAGRLVRRVRAQQQSVGDAVGADAEVRKRLDRRRAVLLGAVGEIKGRDALLLGRGDERPRPRDRPHLLRVFLLPDVPVALLVGQAVAVEEGLERRVVEDRLVEVEDDSGLLVRLLVLLEPGLEPLGGESECLEAAGVVLRGGLHVQVRHEAALLRVGRQRRHLRAGRRLGRPAPARPDAHADDEPRQEEQRPRPPCRLHHSPRSEKGQRRGGPSPPRRAAFYPARRRGPGGTTATLADGGRFRSAGLGACGLLAHGPDPDRGTLMRIATMQTPAGPRAAVRHGDDYVDLHATDPALPASVRALLAAGPEALRAAAAAAARPGAVKVPARGARRLAPVPDPLKIVCIGLNYRDHAAESGAPIPKEPVLFSKYATALIGADEPIVLPPVSQEVDYEAELVIVVGRGGRNLTKERAFDHIAGYTIGHDVSARDWQLKKDGRQWMVGKTFDTFAPLGPELVTPDEVGDPHKLAIRLRLNGETMQDSTTSQMVFGAGELLAYLSQVFTLQPGDLVFTGTPPGVGFARKPPVFLKGGDVVEVEIEKLGVLRNPVVSGAA